MSTYVKMGKDTASSSDKIVTDLYENRLKQAIDLQQQGNLEAAEALYQGLRSERPEDARLLFYGGALALQKGEAARAAKLLEQYIRAHPEHDQAHFFLGEAYRAGGMADRSIEAWERYVERKPADGQAYYELGVSYLTGKRPANAGSAFERFLILNGESPEALLAVGLAYHQIGLPGVASSFYERALERNPTLGLARQNLGVSLHMQGDLDKAEAHYRQVLQADPDNFEVLENLGTLCKERDDLAGALTCYRSAMRIRRAIPRGDARAILAADPRAAMTSLHSLRLEAEQIEFLLQKDVLPKHFERVREDYREIIEELAQRPANGHRLTLTAQQFERIGRYLHRLIHLGPTAAPNGSVLNPKLELESITRAYEGRAPGLAVVDDFLSAEALELLRAYCLESTIWFDFTKAGGYSGSYMQEGFGSDLLLALTRELRDAFPRILGPRPLNQMWAYIYDSERSGITAHADQAAVNLNFWLTPDEANLDPERGGLVVCMREAPAEWDFEQYNNRPDEIRAFVRDSETRVIPYRCNRLVMFHSNLIHATDDFRFKPGLENRRINVTMLFGERSGSASRGI